MPTLEDIVNDFWQVQPHPQEPRLTIGEYPVAARMATTLKFGGENPTPLEIGNFMSEWKAMNTSLQAQGKMPYSPEEFIQSVQHMGKLSFAYHGRPPSMYEIARLRDEHPKDVAGYFAALPDEHYPHVSAGDMVRSLTTANMWSQFHLGRSATKNEAAYLHHSGDNANSYYRTLSQQESD